MTRTDCQPNPIPTPHHLISDWVTASMERSLKNMWIMDAESNTTDTDTRDQYRPRRLIDTSTIRLVEFDNNGNIPPYAILSHHWIDGEEISFEELGFMSEVDTFFLENTQVGESTDTVTLEQNAKKLKLKDGYRKILRACAQARSEGLEYLWVDTCCINQGSHEDVARNIKSMYAYYANAHVCYAYLGDVWRWDWDCLNSEEEEEDNHDQPQEHAKFENSNSNSTRERTRWQRGLFEDSEWFYRGWTLQELLAPQKVVFFDQSWYYIGTKGELRNIISFKTGIPPSVIAATTPVHQVDFRTRMSWAVGRKTTRPQDRAYCLLGILGVEIEPDYEEDIGSAFERLQHAFVEKYPEYGGSFGEGKREDEGYKKSENESQTIYSLVVRRSVEGLMKYRPSASMTVHYRNIRRQRRARINHTHGM